MSNLECQRFQQMANSEDGLIEMRNGILVRKQIRNERQVTRIVVSLILREIIMSFCHGKIGHRNGSKSFDTISKSHWWSSIFKDIMFNRVTYACKQIGHNHKRGISQSERYPRRTEGGDIPRSFWTYDGEGRECPRVH